MKGINWRKIALWVLSIVAVGLASYGSEGLILHIAGNKPLLIAGYIALFWIYPIAKSIGGEDPWVMIFMAHVVIPAPWMLAMDIGEIWKHGKQKREASK